uniref:DNA mismatch repair protein MutS n=1 Tax=Zeugodacus cucurbitae TaxID=28588 RepID=A0A0A1WN25_ZEUCU
MYHKAKCRARLVTKHTVTGDVIHVTSAIHTHKPMYTTAELEIMQKQDLLTHQPKQECETTDVAKQLEPSRPINTLQCLSQLQHIQQFQPLQLRSLFLPPITNVSLLPTQLDKMLPR